MRAFLFILPLLAAVSVHAEGMVPEDAATFDGASSSADRAAACAVDSLRRPTIAGTVHEPSGYENIWVGRYALDMVLLTSATFDGSAGCGDEAGGVALDAAGNVYVAGTVWELSGSSNVWVGKFSADLAFIASATFDGSASLDDRGAAVAVDGSDVYVTGLVSELSGGENVWLARYGTDLVLKASTSFDGSAGGSDAGLGVAAAGGSVFVAGYAEEAAGGRNVWVGEFGADLAFVSSSSYSGAGTADDEGRAAASDGAGGVYVAGGVYDAVTDTDVWIARYGPGLAFVSSASFNGSADGADAGTGIDLGRNGEAYVSGRVVEAAGAENIWLARYGPDLVLRSSASLDGPGTSGDEAACTAADGRGFFYAAGTMNEPASGGLNVWAGRYRVTGDPPYGISVTDVFITSAAVSYTSVDAELITVEVSTASDFSGTVQSSVTSSLAATGLSAGGLWVDQYLYVRAGALRGSAADYSAALATYTLTYAPTWLATVDVQLSSVTLSWGAANNPAGTPYLAQVSTSADFSGVLTSSSTYNLWAELSGLTSNATYYARARSFNQAGRPSHYSSTAAAVTLPAVPSGLTAVSVGSASITLDWQPDGNAEPGTDYELLVATDATFSPTTSVPSGTSTVVLTGLTQSTSYYFRVRALGRTGAAGGFSGDVWTVTLTPLPGTPGTPSGAAIETYAILWSWPSASGASSYNVYPASDPAGPLGASASLGFIQVDLASNTAYGAAVAAVNPTGTGPLSPSATVYTLAAPPAGLAAAQVHTTSASLQWGLNGNPAATWASLERSADGSLFGEVFAGEAAARDDTGLLGCATYYYRVRNRNGDGIWTDYGPTLVFMTQGSTPIAAGGLKAESLSGRRIRLDWTSSPSEEAAWYRIYYDAAAGTVDYGTPLAVVPASSTTYTTGALSAGSVYRFGLRAVNRCGAEEENTGLMASATSVESVSEVSASILAPAAGQRVSGDRVTVLAEPPSGKIARVKNVLFQYKASTASVWTDIAPSGSGQSNPDEAYPFALHWDVTGLEATDYDLRAVATDSGGAADAAPSAVAAAVDPAGYDLRCTDQGGGRVQVQQKVYGGTSNTVLGSDEGTPQWTEVVLPAGAVAQTSATLTLVNSPAGAPAGQQGLFDIGVKSEITLSGAPGELANGGLASVTMAYPDADGDGVVDGTRFRGDELRLYSYSSFSGEWIPGRASVADTDRRTVTGLTGHFSLFGLFVPRRSDVLSVRVYPNPYRPNSGNPDDGVPYSPGDLNSGVVLDRLPDFAQVRIYTVAGERVRSFGSSGTGGRLQWDAKNDRGADVASGVYFIVIEGTDGEKTVKKAAVIR